jgi:hypothetical protein
MNFDFVFGGDVITICAIMITAMNNLFYYFTILFVNQAKNQNMALMSSVKDRVVLALLLVSHCFTGFLVSFKKTMV